VKSATNTYYVEYCIPQYNALDLTLRIPMGRMNWKLHQLQFCVTQNGFKVQNIDKYTTYE